MMRMIIFSISASLLFMACEKQCDCNVNPVASEPEIGLPRIISPLNGDTLTYNYWVDFVVSLPANVPIARVQIYRSAPAAETRSSIYYHEALGMTVSLSVYLAMRNNWVYYYPLVITTQNDTITGRQVRVFCKDEAPRN